MLKTCATLIFPGCAKFGVVVVVVGVAVDVKVEEVVVKVVVVESDTVQRRFVIFFDPEVSNVWLEASFLG